MKRFALVIMVMMLAGCGQPEQQKQAPDKPVAQQRNKDYVRQGMLALQQADPMAAVKNFDEAIKQNPLNVEAYIVLGQTYLRLEDYARAIDTFSAGTRVAPQRGDLYYFLSVSHGVSGNQDLSKLNAQKSVELFRQQKDEQGFLRSLALLQGIMNADDEAVESAVPADVQPTDQ